MPAISPPHSFYAHNDPSFYENHQNLVHTHYDTGYSTMGTEHRNRPTQAYRSSQSMQLPPLPQPPSLAHKVWILDCRSCKTFFTNRGMKAVLLLRPNVPLYSTDALPTNCSAYSSNPEVLRPPPPPSPHGESVRTCECLTQTLCCHGCGNTVGYMIVIPCQRCTSSMSASNRSTNGHRFVFHSSEISASERHYISGEPGVVPFHPPPPPSCPAQHTHTNSIYPTPFPMSGHPVRLSGSHSDPHHSSYSEYLPTPPDERRFDFSRDFSSPGSSPPGSPTFGRPPSISPSGSGFSSSRTSSSSSSHMRFSNPTLPFSPPTLTLAKLKAGDILYWHHLSKHGEIPGVEEDERARGREYTQDGCKPLANSDYDSKSGGGIRLRGMPVYCGR